MRIQTVTSSPMRSEFGSVVIRATSQQRPSISTEAWRFPRACRQSGSKELASAPTRLRLPSGLDPHDSDIRVVFEFDPVGTSGVVRVWNSFKADAFRIDNVAEEGGSRIMPNVECSLGQKESNGAGLEGHSTQRTEVQKRSKSPDPFAFDCISFYVPL